MYNHSSKIPEDDGGPIIFKWHWPRGTFSKRMSAYEIAEFILPHMPNIVPLLSGHPRVQSEFKIILSLLAEPINYKVDTYWSTVGNCFVKEDVPIIYTAWNKRKKDVIDKILPWIKTVRFEADDEWIELNLNSTEVEVGPTYFIGNCANLTLNGKN